LEEKHRGYSENDEVVRLEMHKFINLKRVVALVTVNFIVTSVNGFKDCKEAMVLNDLQ
jgi:hypothetical protein